MTSRIGFSILFCFTFAWMGIGCSPGLCKVNGQIVKNGTPANPKGGMHYQVSLYPLDSGGKAMLDGYPANRGNEHHSFSIPGKTGKGIPPGKYRIGIRMTDAEGSKDLLNGAFGPDNSPIIREITNSDELMIDLAEAGAAPKS